MKLLIFSPNTANYQFPDKSYGYGGGGWISAFINELRKKADVEIGVCFVADGQPKKAVQNGTTFYPVPRPRKAWKDKLIDALHSADVTRDEVLWNHYKTHYRQAIEDFQPDVVHIFGSELYLGLAALVTDKPCILHIQGLLSLSIYIVLPPGVSRGSFIWKDGWRKAWANWQFLNYWNRSVYREKTVLKAVGHVIGRTDWDRQAAEILSPQAQYHFGGEILRPVFYEKVERQIPEKLTIMTTSSAPLYKGFDLILRIANILKNESHVDFEWNVFGNVDPHVAESVTQIKPAGVNVHLRGVATAEQIQEQLRRSTLYFQSSYVENSPNSVCEAQLVGVPVVASNVGGTDSLVEHGKTGLLFPATDPYMGTAKIMQIFKSPNRNTSMGMAAREVALKRHNPEDIVRQMMDVYQSAIKA